MITLPDLPYDRDALEPHISKKTIDFHYGKHHKGYVDNLNKLIKGTSYEGKELERIIEDASGPVYNNAAQVWNHTFFWNCLTPDAKPLELESSFGQAVVGQFGSLEEMKGQFKSAALKLFGSGWVWLVVQNKKLRIKSYRNADNPLKSNDAGLLVLDMWEHAFYTMHQNRKDEYIASFWKVVDWKHVTKIYDSTIK